MEDWRKLITIPEKLVPRYAEYVEPNDLVIGHAYFRLSYIDDAMRIPELVPIIYIGMDLEPSEAEGKRLHYFQDAASYLEGVRWEDDQAPVTGETEAERFECFLRRPCFERYEEGQASVLEFEKAVNLLLGCLVERRRTVADGGA